MALNIGQCFMQCDQMYLLDFIIYLCDIASIIAYKLLLYAILMFLRGQSDTHTSSLTRNQKLGQTFNNITHNLISSLD